MQQYNCQNGQSWYDVCLNTYGSLDYVGKLLSENNGELSVAPTTNTIIFWDDSIVKDSSVLSIIKANNLIYSTLIDADGARISNYTAGISMFDFTPDGSNGWDATFLAEPISVQSLSGATVNDCEYDFNFWSAKTRTHLFQGNTGTDVSFNSGALGAGVYELSEKYILTDGSYFRVRCLYKVSATDTIIASVLMGGVTVNSVSGLSMNVTANIEQVGCSYTPYWVAFDIFDNGTEVGTGITADLALPIGTIFIGCLIDLDSIFSDDYDGDNAIDYTVSIS